MDLGACLDFFLKAKHDIHLLPQCLTKTIDAVILGMMMGWVHVLHQWDFAKHFLVTCRQTKNAFQLLCNRPARDFSFR
jgi:hypothetical protein